MVMVCLAAAVAMIQMNLLLPLADRPQHSFIMNDLMRLPLGILSGVGFIGGGAILRRGDLTTGVTTAATLWLGTVVGLCLGGGQIDLGLAATAIGVIVLWPLKSLENRMRRELRSRLVIEVDADEPTESDIRRMLENASLSIASINVAVNLADRRRKLAFELLTLSRAQNFATPAVVDDLARAPGVKSVEWSAKA